MTITLSPREVQALRLALHLGAEWESGLIDAHVHNLKPEGRKTIRECTRNIAQFKALLARLL